MIERQEFGRQRRFTVQTQFCFWFLAMGQDATKPDYNDLTKNSKFSTKELHDWHKRFKKDFPSGAIDRPQFIELYKKMFGGGPGHDVDAFCDQIYRQYDLDGDGRITFEEFMVTLSVASRGTREEKLRWTFALYDRNGDGHLTEKEIAQMLTAIYKSLGKENPGARAKETTTLILRSADDNGDGRISEKEFIRHASDCKAIKEMLQGF